jgi:hypothetical protein
MREEHRASFSMPGLGGAHRDEVKYNETPGANGQFIYGGERRDEAQLKQHPKSMKFPMRVSELRQVDDLRATFELVQQPQAAPRIHGSRDRVLKKLAPSV